MTDDPAPPKGRRPIPYGLRILGPVAIAFAASQLWLPADDDDRTVWVWLPDVFTWGATASVLGFGWLVAIPILKRGWRHPQPLAIALVIVATFVFLGSAPFWRSGRWSLGSRITTDDGDTYAALGRGFVDRDLAIARRVSNWAIAQRYEVLAREVAGWDNFGHWENWPRVVRAAGNDFDHGLVVRNGHVAFVVAHPTRCLAAATLRGVPVIDGRRHDENESPQLPKLTSSPFFLVGSDDRVNEADVRDLVASISKETTMDLMWPIDLPTDAGLVEALGSDNASVREAAARMVVAGGPFAYPEGSKRLPH